MKMKQISDTTLNHDVFRRFDGSWNGNRRLSFHKKNRKVLLRHLDELEMPDSFWIQVC